MEMISLVNNNIGAKVYIYSGYNNAYWRANGAGYTTIMSEVGVYDIEEAWRRVCHISVDKKISFEFVKQSIVNSSFGRYSNRI